MLTSMTADNVRRQASSAGANAYLTKPIDYNKLIRVVERLVIPEQGDDGDHLLDEGTEGS